MNEINFFLNKKKTGRGPFFHYMLSSLSTLSFIRCFLDFLK